MPLPRRFALLLALLLLLTGGPALAAAQDEDATPAADAEAATPGEGVNAAGDPLVGTPVPYLDENGDELAIVTVVEVTDPYEDFSESFTIEEGTRYVGVEIAVAGTGEQIEANPSDFGLQTVDGFFYGYTFASRDITSASIPDLETITVAVDDEVSGLVFYQIPAAAEPARILWQPDSGRLLVVADLRQ